MPGNCERPIIRTLVDRNIVRRRRSSHGPNPRRQSWRPLSLLCVDAISAWRSQDRVSRIGLPPCCNLVADPQLCAAVQGMLGWRGVYSGLSPSASNCRLHSVGCSRAQSSATVVTWPETTSSSHRRPRAMVLIRRARRSNCSGRTSLRDALCGSSIRRDLLDGGVCQGIVSNWSFGRWMLRLSDLT